MSDKWIEGYVGDRDRTVASLDDLIASIKIANEHRLCQVDSAGRPITSSEYDMDADEEMNKEISLLALKDAAMEAIRVKGNVDTLSKVLAADIKKLEQEIRDAKKQKQSEPKE